jgi:hypothetical protein
MATPSSWVIWGLLGLSWPLWTSVAPLGISSQSSDDWPILYHVAIVSFALGALRGTGAVARLSRSIAQISSAPGLATHLLAVVSIGLLHVLIASAPALVLRILPLGTRGLEPSLRLASVFLTIAALGALLLRLAPAAGSTQWLMGIAILLGPLLLPQPLPTGSLALLAGAMLSASWLLDHPPGHTT